MKTPFLLRVILRDPSGAADKFQMSGKVPACGTIPLIKRLVEPVITGFPREPSVTRGVGQIPIRQTEGICGPHAPRNQRKYSPAWGELSMREKRMKMAVARVLQ